MRGGIPGADRRYSRQRWSGCGAAIIGDFARPGGASAGRHVRGTRSGLPPGRTRADPRAARMQRPERLKAPVSSHGHRGSRANASAAARYARGEARAPGCPRAWRRAGTDTPRGCGAGASGTGFASRTSMPLTARCRAAPGGDMPAAVGKRLRQARRLHARSPSPQHRSATRRRPHRFAHRRRECGIFVPMEHRDR